MDEPFRSVAEIAELLGMRPHAVLSLIASGELCAVDVRLKGATRPRWRISPDDLRAFLDKRTHRVAPPRPPRRKHPTTYREYF